MLPTRTVFIIGAGASKEANLPIGMELKRTIAEKLDFRFKYNSEIERGDYDIFMRLASSYPKDINSYIQAGRQIHKGIELSASIDDFINIHQDNEKIAVCGKLAIAKSILDAERKSKLYFKANNVDDTMNFFTLSATWYSSFFQLIANDVSKNNLDTIFKNIVLIVFNYDRCIEHFLVNAIANNYQVKIEEAKKLVESLTIYRPYGSVGNYFNNNVPFGSESLPTVDDVTSSLKTYCEEINDSDELSAMRKAVDTSLNMVFLGNAYHHNNMKLLFDENLGDARSASPKRIFATRHGISAIDLEIVRRWFNKITNYKGELTLADNYYFAESCTDLFNQCRMSLRT